ncbi:MAG TPA: tRNA (adenosine(37)-N6)-threonylcarbamoyltransferase complex ATPase subunit type 1 TsaE [Thermotogota bacterium]|nr:tRNA (adenosine(37)-N6)-threonylcarbamoyltransferase complex ATPase subunit type 1 TsaE [Thermotogota bacterium]NLH20277.1 tRNA (adenosine(37)-N6)-threonylcarbamoyltransferase complex ATPase subunit type 1 TsaE [Thermotogaceae bacterium]OQC30019.1 MAG: tRNA threonylcarbamoyladenosine biosynthesis protein TsaE [Thermotogota bacterium ADurb.Bin062]HOX64377.1 tRNA (adenosine(37)-N6)-threonylcarbamoyltransferase complex ATPase subunit type 1 TsaE [Thermotogota bacterium]HPL39251.1 tRNA (adenosin
MEKSGHAIARLGLRLESFYRHIDEGELRDLARAYAARIRKGETIFLSGELGSGKTTFMKAVAEAYGYDPSAVRSPTFTLINRYETKETVLFHLDCFRIDAETLSNIGFFDLPTDEARVFIEWPENVLPVFQKADWMFRFQIPEDTLTVRDLWVYRHDEKT